MCQTLLDVVFFVDIHDNAAVQTKQRLGPLFDCLIAVFLKTLFLLHISTFND